ncbi:recombinase family protein [Robinsoniella peoriensis]
MSIYGYHRTSTQDQHLDRGIMEIENYCNNNNLELVKIYTDQQTGKNFNRPRYMVLKEDVLRSGDILIISELDRLGRNKQDTLKELQYYKESGIRVMILEIPTTLQDLSGMENSMAKMILDTINNMLIELYATIAQAEIEKKEKRQQEGIIAKKARGEWEDYGRPKAMDFNEFRIAYERVVNGNIRPFELMKELGLTKPTFYRYKKQYEHLMEKK